jgi:hypothetical protein
MPLTDEMRKIGIKEITTFRYRLWDEADECSYSLLAPDAFLPDQLIGAILDNFPTIKAVEDVHPFTKEYMHISNHIPELFSVIETLQTKFLNMIDPAESVDDVTDRLHEVTVLEGHIRWRINTS